MCIKDTTLLGILMQYLLSPSAIWQQHHICADSFSTREVMVLSFANLDSCDATGRSPMNT